MTKIIKTDYTYSAKTDPEVRAWLLFVDGKAVDGVHTFNVAQGWYEKFVMVRSAGGKLVVKTVKADPKQEGETPRKMLGEVCHGAFEIRDARTGELVMASTGSTGSRQLRPEPVGP